jgi:hypothetical protein
VTAKAKVPCPDCGGTKVPAAARCQRCFHAAQRERKGGIAVSHAQAVPRTQVVWRATHPYARAPRASADAAQCPDSPTGAHHHMVEMGTCIGVCQHCHLVRVHNSQYQQKGDSCRY